MEVYALPHNVTLRINRDENKESVDTLSMSRKSQIGLK